MTLEDDIHSLISLAREDKEKLADRAGEPWMQTDIYFTGWLQGIGDALTLLAREIDDLKRQGMPEDEEDSSGMDDEG